MKKTTKTLTEEFKKNGYVVLENALPEDFVQKMKESFMIHMNKKIRRFGLAPVETHDERHLSNNNVQRDFRPEGGNHDLNRWNMHLPTDPLFINEQLIAHPGILSILDNLLGKNYVAFLIASDTPYPGSGFQNIHQDFPRFGLTVNIPLVDFTTENAPLEIWPGSHIKKTKDQDCSFHTNNVNLSKRDLIEINNTIPSQKMLIKAGSILIRDQRLVHRGTANSGQAPRPCLSIWYKKVENNFDPLNLTIPIPHRSLSDRIAKLALKIREEGKGHGHSISNRALLNLGNFLGRLVEEFSASDRDYRRAIPATLWESFSPRMRQLLRFSSIEKINKANGSNLSQNSSMKGSYLGSAFLLLVTFLFLGARQFFKMKLFLHSAKNSKKESYTESKAA